MEEDIRDLIQLCKKGDLNSFEKLVNQNASRVSNIIYQMLGSKNEVDDLSQEVFIKLYKNINKFKEESKFSTWLYRITVNTVWDYLRKQRYRKTISIDEIEPVHSPVTKDNNELKQMLNIQIQELPIKYKTVLILKDIQELSYREISGILRCRIGTVESRLFRARKILKESLEKTRWWRDFI